MPITSTNTPTPLHSLKLLDLKGAAGVDFLQGYVTADITDATAGAVILAACCTRQGRTIVDLDIIKTGQSLYLGIHCEMVSSLLEHLAPYLRLARMTLTPLDDWKAYCFHQQAIAADAWPKIGSYQAVDGMLLVRPAYAPDWLLCWSNNAAAVTGLLRSGQATMSEAEWQQLEYQSGRVRVTPPITGRFLPQTLGYEQLQGISYSKGCYLGQEIVARTHYRGTLKSKLRRLACSEMAATGTDIVDSSGRKVGTVVSMAADAEGQSKLLAVLSTKLAPEDSLQLQHTQTSLHALE